MPGMGGYRSLNDYILHTVRAFKQDHLSPWDDDPV